MDGHAADHEKGHISLEFRFIRRLPDRAVPPRGFYCESCR